MVMASDMPMVSVVIPCYNMGEFIEETIASVKSQTFRSFEIIVVDDGSDDTKTVACLDRLASDGAVLLYRTSNKGVASARNHGIQKACGTFILPLDADDLIEPNFLEKAIRAFEDRPETAIVCCDAMMFGGLSGLRCLPEFSRERLLSENLLFAASLFRKSDWLAVGGYATAMKYGWEDWDFWIAMTKRGAVIVKIPEPLLKYRIRNDSRDRLMTLRQKTTMLLKIVVRHWECYAGSPVSLIRLVGNSRLSRSL